jgi:hypothetical protein
MSFTNVDTGFTERRYSFDGPDFGSDEFDVRELLDSVDGIDDEPELEEDEEDEEEDDDTESEKAWVSAPGIRM